MTAPRVFSVALAILLGGSACQSPSEGPFEKSMRETSKEVESILGPKKAPIDQLAEAREFLHSKLVPRDQALNDRLTNGFPPVEDAVKSGAIDEKEVDALWRTAYDATKDNLVTGDEVDAFLAKAAAFAK